MSPTWNTKWGVRRVRVEPPTLEEALSAAEGLTSDPLQQAQMAADLMAVPLETIKAEAETILRSRMRRQRTIYAPQSRGAVVVERKPQRKILVGHRR